MCRLYFNAKNKSELEEPKVQPFNRNQYSLYSSYYMASRYKNINVLSNMHNEAIMCSIIELLAVRIVNCNYGAAVQLSNIINI